MFWLWLYIAAMFCIALPVAWFARNEVAGIVFLVWGLGQVAYQLGAPEPGTQIILYGAAFGFLLVRRLQHRLTVPNGSLFAVALFVPLFLICILWGTGTTPEYDAWWGIWFLAMIQAACLVRPIAWCAGAYRWLACKSTVDHGSNMMVRA